MKELHCHFIKWVVYASTISDVYDSLNKSAHQAMSPSQSPSHDDILGALTKRIL